MKKKYQYKKLAYFFIILSVLCVTTSCAELRSFFTRPQRIDGTEMVQVIVKRNVLDADGNPVLDDNGDPLQRDEIVLVERERLVDAGPSPAEEVAQGALPFLGPWGAVVLLAVGAATGWATRNYRDQQRNKKNT